MKHEPTWIARALEGTLSEAERAEFRHRLIHDPAFQEEWARHAWLHGLLGPMMEDAASQKARMTACVETAMREDQVGFIQAVDHKIRRVHFRHRVAWAAAAALLIGAMGFWNMTMRTVATVVDVSAVNGADAPVEGMRFSKGDRLKVESGLVELDLAGRGRMMVEGPAEIVWLGRMGASLASGRVLLNINEQGHGYRLMTPQGSVVDLGTEFGVLIDPESGQVETHVLTGEVEALPGDKGRPVRLIENEALRFSKTESERISANAGAFYRTLPPRRTRDITMVHWSMETEENSTVLARTSNLAPEAATLHLVNRPKSVDGAFGSALYFNGRTSYAESDYPGIGGNHARTVAFWVQVPHNLRRPEHYNIISWGKSDPQSPGSLWHIALNHDHRVGVVGALRLAVEGGMTIGTTDLRDDQWHHVAVVLHPLASPDPDQQVMIFINGEIQSLSNRSLVPIQTDVDEALHGVRLGRVIGGTSATWRYFRGALDEVYIFDAALTQEEIRTLMVRNEPPVSFVD